MALYLGKEKITSILVRQAKFELVEITEGENAGSYKLVVTWEDKWQ